MDGGREKRLAAPKPKQDTLEKLLRERDTHEVHVQCHSRGLLGHSAACYRFTQPFEKAFESGQALVKLGLPVLHGSKPVTQACLHPGHVLPLPGEQPDQQGGEAEKSAKLDAHQYVV